MKNFLRALRYSFVYKRRLIFSVVFAVLAAALWSVTFAALHPVLRILRTRENLQCWIHTEIKKIDGEIDRISPEVKFLTDQESALDALPPATPDEKPIIEKSRRDLARKLSQLEGKLTWARGKQYHFSVAQRFINAWLPTDCFETLVWLIGLVVLAVAVKGVFEFGQEVLVGSVVNLSLFDLRNRFYRNVIHLDVGQFAEQGTGELMARFTNDMESLGTGLKTLFGKVVAEPLRAVGCVLAASYISWQLTLMFLVLVPVAVYVLTWVSRLMKRATRRLLERMSNIYKILQETFQSIRVVKAFTKEPFERRRFHAATRDYYHKSMLVVKLESMTGPVIEALGVAAIAAALLAGAYLVLGKQTHLFGLRMTMVALDSESLILLYAYLAAIADPVRKLSSVYTRIQSGAAAADRVFAFMDRRPQVRANGEGPRLPRHRQSVEFRDLCFSYQPGEPVLTNIHLKVHFGETIALVGKNGSGKTTLVGFLPRFYDPDHGSVLIDGIDVRHAHLRSLRKQIGIVTQDTMLFDDTVYNNIAYGHRRATRERVEEAARRAHADEFIARLPQGYDTRINESGLRLSGGEKQRLALARALLRDPSILILDEFTSQTDAESEVFIHRALKEFARERTVFVITHRLNTLEVADRILVLDNGRLAAVGTHQELLATCPAYTRLHEAHSQRLCA